MKQGRFESVGAMKWSLLLKFLIKCSFRSTIHVVSHEEEDYSFQSSKMCWIWRHEIWNMLVFLFCLTVMIPLLPHWLSIRNLMSLCTGIPTDLSVMIMTGPRPVLMVSLLILLKKLKSTSLGCFYFFQHKDTLWTQIKNSEEEYSTQHWDRQQEEC